MQNAQWRWCAASATVVLLAACHRLLQDEQKLLGKWIAPQHALVEQWQTEDEANEIALRQPGNTIETVYRPDHTWYAGMSGEPPSVFGHWHIEGTELVTTAERGTNAPATERVQIVAITEKKLVVSNGHSEGRLYRQQ